MPAVLPPTRDRTFDLLRGGAVLYIVGYYHIQEIWVMKMPGALAGWLARVALALFCFLSGYLLSNATKIESWRSVGHFYLRRLIKIYPLYLLALAAFVVVGLCPKTLFWPSALLINTLLNWNLLTLWFISMIFLFYLVLPVYLFRPKMRKTILVTAFILILLAVSKRHFGGIDPRLFPNLVAFAFGILVSQSFPIWKFFFQPNWLTKLLSLAGVGFLVHRFPSAPNDALPADILAIVLWFVVALPGLIFLARFLAHLLPDGTIDFLSVASFPLYLMHRLVYHFGEMLYQPPTPGIRQLYFLGALLPLAAFLSFHLQKSWQRLVK